MIPRPGRRTSPSNWIATFARKEYRYTELSGRFNGIILQSEAAAELSKSLSLSLPPVQAGIGLCKDVRSFTSVLEQLELETNDHPELRTSDAQTDYFNDSEQEDAVPVFKTREISTFQLVIQGPEILNFQVQ